MPDKIIHQIQVDGYCARFGGKWGRLQLGTFGSYGIEQLQITLGDSWTDLVVYANFVTADGTTPVLVPESGLVDVPPEATAKPGMGNIVLDGTADGVRIYSVDIPYIMLNHSDLSGEAPAPTPDRWEQFVAQVKGYADAAAESAKGAAASEQNAADSAERAAQAAGEAAGAISQVQDAAKAALDDIATERETALEAVQTEGSKQESAIAGSGTAALEVIGQVEQAAINQVYQAGAEQVDSVNAAGNVQLDKINAANALVPTPTQEDAGKSIIVKSDGSGYELGDIVTDAYTKAESDARYAPIEAAIRPTVSGNPATLEHSVAWAMQGLSVYGKSTQDGEPSPDNPVPIVSAGESGSIAVTVSNGADQSQQLAVSTPNGLPGIPVDSGGNYTDASGKQWVCDEIDFARGVCVQRIGHGILDGTNLKFEASTDGSYWNVENSAPDLAKQYNIISNTFPVNILMGNANYGFIFTQSDIMAPYFQTVDELNAFLVKKNTEGNPVEFYYIKNPVEVPLSPEELAAYAALRSYNGATIVFTEAPVAGLSARYVADGAAYIDGKIQSALAPVNRAILEVNTNV